MKTCSGGDFYRLTAHEGCHFVADNLDHGLSGLNGLDDVLAHGLVLDAVREFFGDLVVDVRVHEGTADFFDRLCNIDVGDSATTAEAVNGGVDPFG